MAERRGGPSGLSPTAAIIVTRVRHPPVRTTRATVLFADLRGYMGMSDFQPLESCRSWTSSSALWRSRSRLAAAGYFTWPAMG
jgi:class 3 adenylate cyclase